MEPSLARELQCGASMRFNKARTCRCCPKPSRLSTVLFLLGGGSNMLGLSLSVESVLTAHGRQLALCVFTMTISLLHGRWIHRSTWSQAKQGLLNMNTLISLSTTLGLISSVVNIVLQGPTTKQTYLQTVSGLIMIVTAGRYLDRLSRRQATNTFCRLVFVTPGDGLGEGIRPESKSFSFHTGLG